MKRILFFLSAGLWMSARLVFAADEPPLDAVIARAVLSYAERTDAATKELAATRERISSERTPLAKNIRALEDQVLALQAEVVRLETEKAGAAEKTQREKTESETLGRNLSFLTNLGLDNLKNFEANLLPGESFTLAEPALALRARLESGARSDSAFASLDTADLFLKHLREQIGGYTAVGRSLVQGGNELVDGTFAFVGPEVFFRAKSGDVAGPVHARNDSEFAVTYTLAEWPDAKAEAVFRGEKGTIPADVTGGKALRLRDSKGTTLDAIRKGGIVGYVILGLGALAAIITLMKLMDVRLLAVDEPGRVRDVTRALALGARKDAVDAIGNLRATTRELFTLGLKYADAPKVVLEEHLEGFVLQQRLHHERRLPLLAVIATAGPLLGLLGTVTGMIRTFTLIKVYGAGGAEKLAGGISEALVATFLGLAVAIPTLVIHGFLSHRVHKGLAMLERYALELVTAVEESRAKPDAEKVLRS